MVATPHDFAHSHHSQSVHEAQETQQTRMVDETRESHEIREAHEACESQSEPRHPLLHGVICPTITITKDDGELDEALFAQHLDHLIAAGIDGVLLFGSIGEFYAFDRALKERAVAFAVNHVAGRMKVLAGVGDTDMDEVLAMTRAACQAGVDAVVAVSPYYFGPSPMVAERYFGAIAEASSVPVVLYNFPARTGTSLSPELVAHLAATYPRICGIKDTVDTISHTREVIAAVRRINPDFAVFSGFDEYYVVNRLSGGDGVICGLTNVEPETFAALRDAYNAGDFAAMQAAGKRVSHLMAVYAQADLFIAAIKAAVKLQGLPISTRLREPFTQATQEQVQRIASILADKHVF